MSNERRYTLKEKLDLLIAYEEAMAVAPDSKELWLARKGLDEEIIEDWRRLAESREIASDAYELPAGFHVDGSILQLAQLYRSQVTQVKPQGHGVRVGAAAGLVVRHPDGRWRVDFLARARSALTAVIAAAKADPEAAGLRTNNNSNTNTKVDLLDAVSDVAAKWGIERFPRLHWDEVMAGGNAPFGENSPPSAGTLDKRVERWEKRIASSEIAFAALREWYGIQRPYSEPITALPPYERETPPSWYGEEPKEWPALEGERVWMRQLAQYRLGDLPELARLGNERQAVIVMRRTAEVIDDYVRGVPGLAGAKIYYQHHVVRIWQWYSMEDLRTAAERAHNTDIREQDKRIVAAVAAMALHTVLRDWKPKAMEETRKRTVDIFDPFGSTRPEAQHRLRAILSRALQSKLPTLQRVVTVDHPAFITGAPPEVATVFYASDDLRMWPGQHEAGRFIAARRRITTDALGRLDDRFRRVVQLADYSANLAVAPPAVQPRLLNGQAELIRKFLLQSTDGEAYGSAVHRNDALGVQRRSYDGAIAHGRVGIEELRRKHAGGLREDRDMLVMEEQLHMNLAGSAVQWIENMLIGDSFWQSQIDQEQWIRLTNFALHEASAAVEIIEQLHAEGELSGKRYRDGFLADENFRFRAWDIFYRCACATATASAAFGFEDPLRGCEAIADLEEIHRCVTTIEQPIVEGELPRLLHSMLWHTFLAGGVLPALHYDAMNSALIDKDPLTRVLSPEELRDPNSRTVMTYTRIALLTDWLISRRWSAGAVGVVAEQSRVYKVLDERSGGLYGLWREDFGEWLDITRVRATEPPREKYSFRTTIGYPGGTGR